MNHVELKADVAAKRAFLKKVQKLGDEVYRLRSRASDDLIHAEAKYLEEYGTLVR